MIDDTSPNNPPPALPSGPRPAAPSKRAAAIFKWTDRCGKSAQSILAVLGLASSAALPAVILLLNQYLAAFGQPALASVGDLVSILSTILPFYLFFVVMLAGFVGLPVFNRWTISLPSFGDHALSGGFGWWKKDAKRADIMKGLMVYAGSHLVGLLFAGSVIATPLLPNFARPYYWIIPALAAAYFLTATFLYRGKRDDESKRRASRTAFVYLYSNVILICWTSILVNVGIHTTSGLIDQTLAAILIVACVLIFHLLVSVAPFSLAIALVLVAATIVIHSAGSTAITAMALKSANLGGGKPTAYRSGEGGTLVVACEIWGIGDTRILWLPDKVGEIRPVTNARQAKSKTADEKTPATKKAACDWEAFRDRAKLGAILASAGDPAAGDAVRTFSREALFDKP